MTRESDRFNTGNPKLCRALRWKGQFIVAETDTTLPASCDGIFWCIHTQTCIGPDREVAEPGKCSSLARACYGSGKMDQEK